MPVVDESVCAKCGLCLTICSGLDLSLSLDYENTSKSDLQGNCLECHIAYSKNPKIRAAGTSGGIVTALISELIEKREYVRAYVLPFYNYEHVPPRLIKATSRREIIDAAKSKYLPASIFNVIEDIRKVELTDSVVVGTSCQIHTIKKALIRLDNTAPNVLYIGLFCDRTLNLNLIKYFEWKYARKEEKIECFDYRNKSSKGWPGDVLIKFDSGREIVIDRRERIRAKPYFQLKRCLFCADKLNVAADISVGDCYIRGHYDPAGKSSVIIRTSKGADVFGRHKRLFHLEKSHIEDIAKTQGIQNKLNSIKLARYYGHKTGIGEYGEPDSSLGDELDSRTRLLELGAQSRFERISIALEKNNGEGLIKKLKAAAKYSILLWKSFWITLTKTIPEIISDRSYIGVVGGGFDNKGAEAMVFACVNELKKRFPDKEIIVFTNKAYPEKMRSRFAFRVVPLTLRLIERLLCGIFPPGEFANREREVRKLISNTSAIFDISGFALSSQFSPDTSLYYSLRIILARKYSVPFFVLPQSFGPFDYPKKCAIFLKPMIKMAVKYPFAIFAREKNSAKLLKEYTGTESKCTPDIVLQRDALDLEFIFGDVTRIEEIEITPNSVAIVPNERLFERANRSDLISAHVATIQELLDSGKNVYLLRHSTEDWGLCVTLKGYFKDNENVMSLIDDYNACQLDSVMSKFDFIIGSRYHSIIHAYRNGVPAVVVGWADKYVELARLFYQKKYFVDARQDKNCDQIKAKTIAMLNNYIEEQKNVTHRATDIRQMSVFEEIIEKYR